MTNIHILKKRLKNSAIIITKLKQKRKNDNTYKIRKLESQMANTKEKLTKLKEGKKKK